MEKDLAIFDTDGLYAERLAEYINDKAEIYGVKAHAFASEEELGDYLQETAPEFLLCAETVESSEGTEPLCRQQYRLSSAPPPEKDAHTISKFQSAEQIMKKLMSGQLQGMRQQILDKVLERMDYSREVPDEELLQLVDEVLEAEMDVNLTGAERRQLTKDVFNGII